MNELIIIEPGIVDAITIFTKPTGIDEVLKDIKTKALADYTPDVSTDKGRKEIASRAYKVAQSSTLLDGLGKELGSDWDQKKKALDKDRRRAREFLMNLKNEIRQPLTDWEDAEKLKAKAEAEAKQYALDWDEAINQNAIFDKEQALLKQENELKLREAAVAEAERIEQERQAKIANAARLKQILEETRIKTEKETQERMQREAAAKKAAEEAEVAKRQADVEHKRIVLREAVDCLIFELDVDWEVAMEIVDKIAAGKIKNISIQY